MYLRPCARDLMASVIPNKYHLNLPLIPEIQVKRSRSQVCSYDCVLSSSVISLDSRSPDYVFSILELNSSSFTLGVCDPLTNAPSSVRDVRNPECVFSILDLRLTHSMEPCTRHSRILPFLLRNVFSCTGEPLPYISLLLYTLAPRSFKDHISP
jgi:hypothetical protein